MSCERGNNKVAQAGTQAGVSNLAGKSAYNSISTFAKLSQSINKVGQQATNAQLNLVAKVSPVSNKLLAVSDATAKLANRSFIGKIAKNKLARRVFGLTAGQVTRKIAIVSKLSSMATGTVGNVAARISRQEAVATVQHHKKTLGLFNTKTKTEFWQSSLSPLINRQDHYVSNKDVTHSTGVMFKAKNTTWHSGSTTFKLPDGQQRNITHLQNLSIPATHYYFNRPLSNKETVDIAHNQIKAEQLPGYVGQVSSTESLIPSWGAAKHHLIKTKIHFPPQSTPQEG